jgi:PAS domain S-box-containing protein
MNNPLHVLMVEDSEDDALLAIRALKKGGYEPVYECVENAGAMRTALGEKRWDVILCDYQMPKFNGLAAIALLKETQIDVPLIIVSGAIGEETAVECMRSGAHDYIMKGNLSRLVPAIERELKEAESRKNRKYAEQALRKSEERYAALFRGAAEGILIAEMVSKMFIYANPAICRMLDYSEEEMKHLGVQDIHPAESLEHVLGEFEAQARGEKLLVELPCRRKDGSVIYASISACNMVIDNKLCTVGFFSDITERKKVEAAIQRERGFTDAILNSLPGVVYCYDRNFRFLRWNENFERVLGYTAAEIARMSPLDFYAGPDKELLAARIQEVFEKGESDVEADFVAKDGTRTPYHFTGVSTEIDGKPHLVGVGVDISARKQAEEAFRESEQRFMDVLYSSPDAVLLIDGEKFVDCNEATARILGYSSRDMFLKTHPSELSPPTQPDGRNSFEKANEMMRAALDRGFNQFEWEHRRANGEVFPVEVSLTSIVHHGKNVIHCMWRDLTERKRAENDLKQSFNSLQDALTGAVQAMAVVVESRDPYTAGHQRRVAELAHAIASEMRLPTNQIDGIQMAAVIHDLGKIAVPAEILSKPTKLKKSEFELIKDHPQAGYEILKDIAFPWPIARIILEHHEMMDGSGYPNGAVGENMLLESKILTVADVVEAMASHRPYRPALGIDAALKELENNKGTHYDATVVDACLRLFREKGFKLEGY